jgi:hypothetical protein
MGPNGFMPDIPPGAIGAIYSSDPVVASPGTGSFILMGSPWHTSSNSGLNTTRVTNANGCTFALGASGSITDLTTWLPITDVYGNSLDPATNPFLSVTLASPTRVSFNGTTNQRWQNYHNAALNATDNAAYRARTNGTIPATMFVIGLGGNTGGGPPVDHVLLQRIANDPAGDAFNSPQAYTSCATNAGCVNYSDEPQGTYIYSVDKNELRSAFLRLSSQILRLSK